MPSLGTIVWSSLFLVLPVLFLALVIFAWGGNPVAVFAALAWLVLGVVLAPFVRPTAA